MDRARSDDPAVQRQLDRLSLRSPGRDILGLERITALLDRLGNPQDRTPPIFHVAGTNGKGSTCAFLRACIEAAGLRTHVYTSPHLVRFNERIRLAGELIDDAMLADLLEEVLRVSDDLGASFFEVTTAVALLAFARVPAHACVVEVGLGGRLDATNVFAAPAACGIAALGIDHQSFLGDTLGEIAAEKAGIGRAGVPLVTFAYEPEAESAVARTAERIGAGRLKLGEAWHLDGTSYRDSRGTLRLGTLGLAGDHQGVNAGLALAMLRHQDVISVADDAMVAGLANAHWPARMQRLQHGPLIGEREVWLDGGHNASAAAAIAATLAGRRLDLIVGMLENKDAESFLAQLAPVAASVTGVPVADHDHHSPTALAVLARRLGLSGRDAATVSDALSLTTGPILITGSLYLAGEVLAANGQLPQ